MLRAREAIPNLLLQFSGDETPEFCESLASGRYLKVFHLGGPSDDEVLRTVGRYTGSLPMFDAAHPEKRGGTGTAFPWTRLAGNGRPPTFVVSGGLTPENVGECVRTVRPYAVDVRSGVESNGRKDEQKMRAFVRAVREADGQA